MQLSDYDIAVFFRAAEYVDNTFIVLAYHAMHQRSNKTNMSTGTIYCQFVSLCIS